MTTIDEDGNEITGGLIDVSQSVALARAEIDIQISTARAYPRSPSKIQKAMLELVALDKEAAAESMYALPVDGKPVTGPSIRFAEALKVSFGNCAAASRVVEINRAEMYVEAEGVFFDLETNVRTIIRARRSIRGKSGKVYSDRVIITTCGAAASIAMREAILKGVPKPIWRAAYDAVVQTIKGDIKTLVERREKAVAAFANYGVSAERIFARLQVAGMEDIGLDDLPELFAMYQSIKGGEATVEDYFPPIQGAAYNPMGDDNKATNDPPKTTEDPKAGETIKRTRRTKAEMQAAKDAEAGASGQEAGEGQPAPSQTNAETSAPVSEPAAGVDGGAQRDVVQQEDGKEVASDPSPSVPKTEAEFLSYTADWLAKATSISFVTQKWGQERQLRSSFSNIPIDDLLKMKADRISEIEAKESA